MRLRCSNLRVDLNLTYKYQTNLKECLGDKLSSFCSIASDSDGKRFLTPTAILRRGRRERDRGRASAGTIPLSDSRNHPHSPDPSCSDAPLSVFRRRCVGGRADVVDDGQADRRRRRISPTDRRLQRAAESFQLRRVSGN